MHKPSCEKGASAIAAQQHILAKHILPTITPDPR